MGRQREPPGPADERGLPSEREDRVYSSASEYGSTWESDDAPRMTKTKGRLTMSKFGSFMASRKVEEFRDSPAANLATWVFMPWVVFTIVMCPFALGFRHFQTLAWVIFVLAVLMSLGLLAAGMGDQESVDKRRHSYWRCLGSLCLGASLLGLGLGLYGYFRHVAVYHVYGASRLYTNVLPSKAPSEFMDAGMFAFSQETYVDPTRSVGYMAVRRYCAAPLFNRAAAVNQTAPGTLPKANFWAVGLDCCHKRGLFECGPVWDETAHSALRVLDASPLKPQDRPYYMIAVREAAAAYGLEAPENAILVLWTKYPERLPQAHWENGVHFYKRAVGIYIAVVLVLGLFAALYWDARRVRAPTM